MNDKILHKNLIFDFDFWEESYATEIFFETKGNTFDIKSTNC